MTLPHTLSHSLLAAALLLLPSVAQTTPVPSKTVLASGPLLNLDGQEVGQVHLEQQDGRVYVQVRGAGRAAGANLELLVSASSRALRAGDHGGPGQGAIRISSIQRGDVRSLLPATLLPSSVRSVWVWCPAVKLPSARALLNRSAQ
ncbi:hypothetical protein E7T06_20510 [Deinococcus sp. Arct2-2]|uniref:hypothetical protein n=1 Tax=Deinococcus sp. Arct2-2 TaxID=2568653 RepID=UPI0010A45E30|nr:hypothetical protein [Deinococcus sp. Arct2-2]THF66738.1 hypothetical protein E7T06_20510 [Deinococcus sp. Arct2-2]